MRIPVWPSAALIFLAFSPALAAEPLTLVRITPAGEDVPPGRQIVFEFNRPVVPVGRMERSADEIPVRIEPKAACQWRWLNTTTLACQLDEQAALAPATRYRVSVQPGIKTQDGASLAAPVAHSFVTQRAKVANQWFKTWHAPGMPAIVTVFNQPVTGDSVAKSLYFQGADGKRVDAAVEQVKEHRGRGWVVRPVVALPADGAARLRVAPGVRATRGTEPGIEDRVLVEFDTFPAFHFLGVRCTTNAGEKITFAPARAEAKRCNPLEEIALLFSTPVLNQEVKAHARFTPDLAGGRADYDPWADAGSYSRLTQPHKRGETYALPLPELLKANQDYRVQIAAGLRDEFGRRLQTPVDLRFATDHRAPSYHLEHEVSVLEKNADTHLPLIVNNLDKVRLRYQVLTPDGKTDRREQTVRVDKAEDIAYAMPIKLRQFMAGKSGVIQGEIDTVPKVRDKPQWFFSQVTPYSVQAKIGHFNTLVWVTRFDTGAPVGGARVQVYADRMDTLGGGAVLTEAATDSNGVALLKGTSALDPELKVLNKWERNVPHLFVRVQKDADMALMPLTHDFRLWSLGADDGYVDSRLQRRYGHIHTWGTTAQGVYRVGDTVQFKFYVRNQDNRRFTAPPRAGYALKVEDPTGKVVHEVKHLALSEFGAYAGEFSVPQTAAVGWYRFVLSAGFAQGAWEPMRVLVSDFTPAPFRVSAVLNGELFKPGDAVKVETQARLHAGGPYADAQARVTALVRARALTPPDPQVQGFFFDVSGTLPEEMMHQSDAGLNDQGDLTTRFRLAQSKILYGELQVESAVRDDRGKYVAGRTRAAYVGRDRYVGLRQKDWVLTQGTPANIEAVVVDAQGKPVRGTPIEVKIEQRETRAARAKSAGNAYVTHYEHAWVARETCKRVAEDKPVTCSFTPGAPGTYRFIAGIADTQARAHATTLERWAVGKGQVLWETPADETLKVMPEKKEYRVGEKARYLVQNPFPGARALITVERFGVQKSWTRVFRNSTEVIEFEIEPDHLPGFYLSVVVTSPRVDKPVTDGQVDLGKPAFRIGYVKVPVKDAYKELAVEVKPQPAAVKPREKVRVDLAVRTRQGDTPKTELAVAVVDEAVFDLIARGRDYFDPYKGFYTLDPLDVGNYNLLTRLIGRQNFAKKGANTGGDGGPDLDLRSLFKFVAYWNPALRTDRKGRASIEFSVPDNLTGWRVLALAVTPDDRMGLGEGGFKVNQPTELRPALPNQVLEGDRFEASFTVMNRTPQARTLDVRVEAQGAVAATPGVTQQIQAEPYKRYTVRLPLQATRAGEIVLTARAGDAADRDALRLPLNVHRRQALETAATYGTTTAPAASETIAFPPDIRTDVGGVSVAASPSVIGDVDGAFKYLRDYPYVCWEQVLTKGVMAAHYRGLKTYLSPSFTWKEADALPAQTLKLAANFQAPNGGMAFYLPEDQYADPYLSAYTALAFNWLRASGHAVPRQVEERLHAYLQTFLRRDVAPEFYSKGMSASVRALALAALAGSNRLTLADLERYRSHVPQMSLFGKAHYLAAATRVAGSAQIQGEVANDIRAHVNETGGKLVFSDAVDAGHRRILESSLRTNCAVLSGLLAYETQPQEGAADAATKLVRTITQARKQRDRWENTQENMFCMTALLDYSRVYEKDKPNMTVRAWLDQEKFGEAQFKDVRGQAAEFARPLGKGDPGRTAALKLERTGSGRLYYAARLSYSPLELKRESINAGIEVQREYSVERNGRWVLLQSPLRIKTGELVKVDLYVSLPAARNFVVVDDPVPGGLEPVNRDLATASTVDAAKAQHKHADGAFWFRHGDWREYGFSRWSFYHKELRHHAARFYSEYLPAGRYHLSYVAQAIAPGEFSVLPTHAEEMYDPDVYGKAVPAVLQVEAAP